MSAKKKAAVPPPDTWADGPHALPLVVSTATSLYASGRAKNIDAAVSEAITLVYRAENCLASHRELLLETERAIRAECEKLKPMTPSQAACYITGDSQQTRAWRKLEAWLAEHPADDNKQPDASFRLSMMKFLGDRHISIGQPVWRHLAISTKMKLEMLVDQPAKRKWWDVAVIASLRLEWVAKQQHEKK